jgi:hypothetical protein
MVIEYICIVLEKQENGFFDFFKQIDQLLVLKVLPKIPEW